jgi:hypothetical protein
MESIFIVAAAACRKPSPSVCTLLLAGVSARHGSVEGQLEKGLSEKSEPDELPFLTREIGFTHCHEPWVAAPVLQPIRDPLNRLRPEVTDGLVDVICAHVSSPAVSMSVLSSRLRARRMRKAAVQGCTDGGRGPSTRKPTDLITKR